MRCFIKRAIIFMAVVLFALPLAGRKDVLAEGESVIYVFSGLEVPEGQSELFPVDSATIDIFRQNPAVINVFVAALAQKYNTSTAVIDQAAEAGYLLSVANGSAPGGNHVPTYVSLISAGLPAIPVPAVPADNGGEAEVPQFVITGNMDINNGNYIDINIPAQTLTLFQNGVGTCSTPIVTGNVRAGHNTPQGLFAVQYKQRDRTLKGEDYESFVHYWMRIVNNVGIHDANWRSKFGGEIYKTSGSHGCINVPPPFMPNLYNTVPEGMPVWVHS